MTEELNICHLASDKSPNNYHSWNHRMWIINKLKTLNKQFDLNYLFIKEYSFSERWTSKHVSDFSCFHYRQFCLKNICLISDSGWKTFESTLDVNLRKNFVKVLGQHFPKDVTIQASEQDLISYTEDNLVNLLLSYTAKNCKCIVNNVLVCRKLEVLFYELTLNDELLRFFKYHETLWYHRRFIVHEIITIMYENFGLVRQNGSLIRNICSRCNGDELRQKQAKIGRYDGSSVYSSVLFNVVKSNEMKFIEERRNDGDNYADRHEKYLKFIKGLNNVL